MPKLERRLRSQLQTRHDWHSCRVYRSTNQLIGTGAWTPISFDNERWDTSPNDNIWAIGAPTRLTCRRAGKYQITGNIQFDANNAGRRGINIYLNGASQIGVQFGPPSPTGNTVLHISSLWYLNVGNWVELRAFQDGVANLNVLRIADYSPEFMMARVG